MSNKPLLAPEAPGRLPGVGHLLPLLRNPMVFLQSLRPIGDIVRIHVGPSLVYVVNAPELLYQLLVVEAKSLEKGRAFDRAKLLIGDALPTAEGEFHLRQRRMIQPAFHHERIASWTTVMRDCANTRINAWQNGQTLHIAEEMHELSLAVLLKTLIAADLDPAIRQKFFAATRIFVKELTFQLLYPTEKLRKLPTPGNLRFRRATADLRSVLDAVIAAYQADDRDRGDIFSMLCRADADDGYSMTDEQVRNEGLAILVAGTETTANTLSWLCYELGKHTDIQERVRAEIRQVVGDREITGADIQQLQYLQQVVNETLRLHTPNWILTRRTKNDLNLGGITLPSGADILLSLSALHRDPTLYPEPMKFLPERWGPHRSAPDRGTFMPFGAGIRKCIGDAFAKAEILNLAATLFARWRMTLHPDASVRESKAMATLQPVGLRMIPHDAPRGQ